jgi:predicted regulator of Ras-like GTPase activity (Roadblock/LC7/MglB family)
MSVSDLVILEEDQKRLLGLLERLRSDSNARLVFLLDKNGQQIASSGSLDGIDPTALASLTAGNVAATEGLARLIGEREFGILFHEGERDSLHINVVGGRAILVVLFDERSSLGLVRLRVKKATSEIESVLEAARERSRGKTGPGSVAPFPEITDEDIEALFG